MNNKQTLNPETEREFDKEFIKPFGDGTRNAVWSLEMEEKLKQFIAKVEQRARDEERERIIEAIEYNNEDFGWGSNAEEIISVIKEELRSLTPPTTNERAE